MTNTPRDMRPYTERCVSCGRSSVVQQLGDRCVTCTKRLLALGLLDEIAAFTPRRSNWRPLKGDF